MRIRLRLLALLAIALAGTGCFERYTRIRVRADGSGELVETTRIRNAYLDYVKGLSGGSDPTRAITRDGLEAAASKFGRGVEYQSHTLTPGTTHLTIECRYTFKDLTTVEVGLDPTLPLVGKAKSGDLPRFPRFSFHHRGEGRFTIYPPRSSANPADTTRVRVESDEAKQQQKERLAHEREQWMQFGNPFELTGKESREDLIRRLGRGMRFRLELEALDPIQSTTAPYRIGPSRIILYSIELDKLMKDETLRKLLTQPSAPPIRWGDLIRSKATLIESGEFRLLELTSPPAP